MHVVLVSDRGPVRFAGQIEDPVPEFCSGSVTALLHRVAGAAGYPVAWLAPSTSATDGHAMRRGLFGDLAGQLGYSPQVVLIDKQEYDRYYLDTGVEIIWSAWHGIEDDVPVRTAADRWLAPLASYKHVNQRMAERVAQQAAPAAVVAVQDYQLMLAPAMIRALRPDVRLVHFSHTPFPDAGSLAGVPAPLLRSLVHGMLGADLLGFQRAQWADRFLRCCRRLGLDVDQERGWVRHDGRRIWVRCYPVSVDIPSLTDRARTPEVGRWAARTTADDRAMRIVRVDRLDPAKNALRGFEAYSSLLRRHPALAREARFVACLVPSRERLPSYQRYAARVRRMVDDINDRYPGAVMVHHGENQDRALGVLRGYDVLLVNSVTDGMNLVAQEGPVINTKDGAVVLSAGAGAADLLTGAVLLEQPRDVAATTDALAAALALSPAERRNRAGRMRAAIVGMDAANWLDRQLSDVLAAAAGSAPTTQAPKCAPRSALPILDAGLA
ncbi:MAG: trehalose-6-phosphate synthase [Actinophytocola sp.]|uniref:trehalose-6-phosphate synthase n=1 Tax=Actinophytocola sp. TaxID=1872138 RepID=UPI003C79389A